ncbi:MAG: M3 family oligoendopeptidase, partial [Bacillota bacterium]|nr:M3 family oligoendopeptidase [Bacillota bacterium]
MRFEDYTYLRPNLEEVKREFEAALEKFNGANSIEEQCQAMNEINRIKNDIGTMFNLCSIRHSINTEDEFYKMEQDYMDELDPEIEGLTTKYYQALVHSRFRKELEQKWGTQLFALAESQLKTFKPEVISLLQKENRLSTEYTKL